ncbi:hypothetical protein OHU34_16050 [Streptomyces sp. NBC_00080]|uniref:hypothetical protein n=1 Tax=Streptomyces sp. NBC_00080 TaxID=2975645 RepID=UPI0032518A20
MSKLGAEPVVVGPAAPPVAGVADAVGDAGIPVCGPSGGADCDLGVAVDHRVFRHHRHML